MLTAARLREDVRPAGLDWITALRAPQVKNLVRDGALQLTLFDQTGPGRDHLPGLPRRAAGGLQEPVPGSRAGPQAGIPARGHRGRPGENRRRLRAGPAPAARQRQDRAAGGQSPQPAQGRQALHHRHRRRPVQLPPQPGLHHRRGRPGRHLRAAHQRRARRPGHPARSSPPTRRSPRSSGPSAPSIPTWTSAPSGTAPRTGSAPTCSCACCRTTSPGTCTPGSRPLLFTDDDKPAARAARPSPVAPAARSPRALAKAAAKRTDDGLPVHSSASLLADLATICLNTIAPADPALPGFRLVTTPTPLQRQALDLLGVSHRLGIA